MRQRKRLLNKIVSIIMVFLMIAAVFIQPISAEETSNTAEISAPESTEESKPAAEDSSPTGKEEGNPAPEGSNPSGTEESKTAAEGSDPSGTEESNRAAEGADPLGTEESSPVVESSSPTGANEGNITFESNEPSSVSSESQNVLGNLKKDENPLPGVTISIYNPAEDNWYDTESDQNGNFGFTLSDGEYQLNGIWLDSESKWYPLDLSLTVLEGVLVDPNLLQLDLSKPAPNVNGSVMKDGLPVAGTWVNVSTVTGETKWYNAQTNENGDYHISLPDGEYQIDDVWVGSESKLYPVAKSFKVQDNTVVNPEVLNLDLSEPAPNVNGSVVKDGQPVAGAIINARTVTGAEKWFDAPTDENGNYILNLPDGEFQITGVWVGSESKWYPLDVSFTVQDGAVINSEVLNLDLTEKGPNTNGSVMKDGQPVTDVWVNAHTVTGVEQWFNGKTDENGKFSMTLPDGEYQIEGIWIDSESKWYPSVIAFTVKDGEVVDPNKLHIDLSEKPLNVNGSVVKDGKPVAGVWVNAHTVTGEEIWFNDLTDVNGNYGLTLPDGDFKIEGIWVEEEQKWYPLSLNFSVVDKVLQGQSELVIDLTAEPKLNVKGSISDENGKIANVDITIKSVDTGEYFYSSTNENGEFGLQLADGQYKIELVVVDGALNNPIYLDKEFSVENEELQIAGVETEFLNVTLPPSSLNVQIVKEREPLKNIEVEIVQPNEKADRYMSKVVDENGIASFRLLDGEYRVTGYYEGGKFYYLDQAIIVTNGTTSPNPFIIDVTNNGLTTLQGSLSDSNGFVGNSEVTFYNETIGDIFFTDVNSEGSYSADLPDGEYSIESIYSDAFNYVYDVKLNTDYDRFTISEGKTLINGNEIEKLDLNIPTESLKVQILNNGIPVQGDILIYSSSDQWYAQSNENGELTLRVPNGDYTVESFYDGVTDYSINRITTADIDNPVTWVIDLAKNENGIVNGIVMDGNTPLADGQFMIDNTNDFLAFYHVVTDENGQFSADIPDGAYVISTVYDANGHPIASIDLFFSVKNGEMVVNQKVVNDVTIDLPSESLHVQILNNGTPLNGEVNFTKMVSGYELSYIVETDENGEFVLRVPDGVYTISGLYEMEEPFDWYVMNTDVEVLHGTTTPNPFVIDLNHDTEKEYHGVVQDENGPQSGGFVLIEDTASDNWTSVDVNEVGEFVFDLPDGNYVVTQYFSETVGDVSLQIHFSIQDGQIMVNGKATDQLNITLPSVAVKGTVVDDIGTPISGGEIRIIEMNDAEAYSRFWVIDGNGQFSLRLPDGEYKVTSISQNDESSIPMQRSFSVQDGALMVDGAVQERLNLQLPQSNFNGQLLQLGEPLADSTIYLLSNYGPDQSFSFPKLTDGNGYFSERLGDGSYLITGIETPSFQYIEFYQEFEVINGITSIDFSTIEVSEGNVQGLVQDVDGKTYGGGGFLDIQDPNGEWYYADVTSNGEFSIQLLDGEYTVVGLLSNDTGYIDLQVHFTVQNGELVNPLVITMPTHY